MTNHAQATMFAGLYEWFQTPQGLGVARAFQEELGKVSNLVTGRAMIQLGYCGQNLWWPQLKGRYKWLISPYMHHARSAIYAYVNFLPLERHSIDCVLAPLTLDMCANPTTVLDEIDRVLKPMGHAIFFGINPWSFWGAVSHWGYLAGLGSTTLTSALSLKHALFQRGYHQCYLSSFYYVPPVNQAFLIRHLRFLNEMGKMLWPFPAGFYCLVVKKYADCRAGMYLNQDEMHLVYS